MTRTFLLSLCFFVALALGLAVAPGPRGSGVALAQVVDQPLPDPEMEKRAVALHKRVRCLVCQNQSIHDSEADLARDLRGIVRERLAAGDSDEAALQYLVDRYGDWALLRPPLNTRTIALWGGPLVLLLLGAGAAVAFYRRSLRTVAGPEPLSADERRRVQELLGD